jgi:hypothetical protein
MGKEPDWKPRATRRIRTMSTKLRAGAALGAGFAALALAGSMGPAATAAGGGCANANESVENLSKGDAARAIICLFNNERTTALDRNGDLTDAAQFHSDVMRQKECFKHKCNGEPGLFRRVKATGYLNGASDPRVGELIAFGNDKPPADFVDKWLDSSEHRALIKDASFRDAGVGINTQGGNALITAVLGHR